MAHYIKLFDSLIHSTLWQEDLHIKVVWVTMLAMADSNGEVYASIPGLAKAAGVTIPQCEEALGVFLAPDPYSRSKECEGRRLCEIKGGWELINYKYYRELKSSEQEKEFAAERAKRYRDRKKGVTPVTENHGSSRQEEEDVDETKSKNIEAPSGASCPEPVKPSPGSPALYEVACVGTGAKKWPLTQEKLDEWIQAFPGVDVKLELRKAIQWLKDNPSKAKTYRGLPAFFGRWLSTAQDKPKNGAPKIHAPSHRASADQSLLDQLANQEKEAPSATKYNAIEEFLAQM